MKQDNKDQFTCMHIHRKIIAGAKAMMVLLLLVSGLKRGAIMLCFLVSLRLLTLVKFDVFLMLSTTTMT